MSKNCPIEYTLSLISGKWKILILKELSRSPVRYSKLRKLIPNISPKVLTQNLREMEQDGLVTRVVFPEVPPRVEYSLSEKGASIFTVFIELRRWGLELPEAEGVSCSCCQKCVIPVYTGNSAV